MKPEIVDLIECPGCQSTDIRLEVDLEDHHEIRSGYVVCIHCNKVYSICNGILYLYDELPETVIQEKEQTEAHLAKRSEYNEYNSEWLLKLPILDDDELGLGRLLTFEKAMRLVNWAKDSVVLDFGCGTCWTTWRCAGFSKACIALDTSDHEIHGLGSFETYRKAGRPYFDRIVGDLNQLSFRKGVFDLIFTSASIHHAISVSRVFQRIYRLLKPGGVFVMINEPVCSILKKDTVLQQEAREHLSSIERPHNIFQYRRFARQAGFNEVCYLEWFNHKTRSFNKPKGPVIDTAKRLAVLLWRNSFTQRAFRKILFLLTVFFGADYGIRGWPLLGRINFFMVMRKNR